MGLGFTSQCWSVCWGFQTAGQSGEQELENLVLKLSVLKDFLSSIEKKVRLERQGWMP